MITSGDLFDELVNFWEENSRPRNFFVGSQLYRYIQQEDLNIGFLAIDPEDDRVDYIDPQTHKQWLEYYGPDTERISGRGEI